MTDVWCSGRGGPSVGQARHVQKERAGEQLHPHRQNSLSAQGWMALEECRQISLYQEGALVECETYSYSGRRQCNLIRYKNALVMQL